ncbi:MAG: PIG-L family deacetylase [Candidatus Sumerlaeota bacterium]|nr:PIG-L family deacetylase [Candidatus Sumerlaeota bacterium]
MPPQPPRVCALMAHPDDIEFICAGTLIALGQAGCPITMITMTAGDCGSREHDQQAIAAIRRAEAARSARLLGAEYVCLEFEDLRIFRDNDSAQRVTEALRRARPDVLITHSPVDYMGDHEETSRMARDACFFAPIPNYRTFAADVAPILDAAPALYFGDPIQGRDYFHNLIEPQFYVDIADAMEKKVEMLCCHASQRDWLRAQHGVDEYVEMLKEWNAMRGAEAGAPYAEAFRQYLGHGFPQENVLARWIGERIRTK